MMVIDPLDRLRGPVRRRRRPRLRSARADPRHAGLAVPPQLRALRHLPQRARTRRSPGTMLGRVRAERGRHARRSDARASPSSRPTTSGRRATTRRRRLRAAVRRQPRRRLDLPGLPHAGGHRARREPAASLRDDLPLHEFVGANTFIPRSCRIIRRSAPRWTPTILQEGVDKATDMLRQAATVAATLAGGTLDRARHERDRPQAADRLPRGRRMWLHVRAFDAERGGRLRVRALRLRDRRPRRLRALPERSRLRSVPPRLGDESGHEPGARRGRRHARRARRFTWS